MPGDAAVGGIGKGDVVETELFIIFNHRIFAHQQNIFFIHQTRAPDKLVHQERGIAPALKFRFDGQGENHQIFAAGLMADHVFQTLIRQVRLAGGGAVDEADNLAVAFHRQEALWKRKDSFADATLGSALGRREAACLHLRANMRVVNSRLPDSELFHLSSLGFRRKKPYLTA